jgi:hypothetical protein
MTSLELWRWLKSVGTSVPSQPLVIHYAIIVNQEGPQWTVQTFIDLVQWHEQSFYSFVHKVHSKGKGFFDSLMHWIELFLTAVREGLGNPVSLEFLLPHTSQE